MKLHNPYTQKETVDAFFRRVYYIHPRVLVYRHPSHMQKEDSEDPPEVWDLQTARNYLEFLERL